MLTIGLLGGMSWDSTQTYYQLLNEGIKQDRGGLHSAKIILNSLDFADIEALQHAGDWPATADILTSAAQAVERAIQSGIKIPILHIADAPALALKAAGIHAKAAISKALGQ